MKEFKTSDDLAFAINRAIADLQNIVKDLPQGATKEELRETIKQTDSVVYTLISSVDNVERKLNKDEKDNSFNANLIGAVSRFFERGTTRKASNS